MAVLLHGVLNGCRETLPERFERKYYLSPVETGVAYGLLSQVCLPTRDYHSEQINSLYFDTRDLDQYERSDSGDYGKDKVRIRWYGEEEDLKGMQTVFVELKSRRGFAGTKQRLRIEVHADSLAGSSLGDGIVPRDFLMDTLARFGYCPPGLLFPVVSISYWRHRFIDFATSQGVSLDTRIKSTMIIAGPGNGEKGLELPGGVVEIKGQHVSLSTPLSHTRMLHTDWTRFSKYSACIDAHNEKPGTLGRLSTSGRVARF